MESIWEPGIDIGILASRRLNTDSCLDGFVDCINGNTTPSDDGSTISCQEECNGRCCVGESACDGFTGKVCIDDTSCFGYKSCYDSKIDTIVNGCNGTLACIQPVAGDSLVK